MKINTLSQPASSSRRKPGSNPQSKVTKPLLSKGWIPAFAGMTVLCLSVFSAAMEPTEFKEKLIYIDSLVEKGKIEKRDRTLLIEAATQIKSPLLLKERAVWAIGQLELRKDVDVLVSAAKHKSFLVRQAAISGLLHLRARSGLNVFIQTAKKDPILSLRQRATVALGLLRWEKTIDSLVELSDDPTIEIRGASVLGMAATHSNKNNFKEILNQMSQDKSPYVASRAKIGLSLANKDFSKTSRYLNLPDPDIRLFTALFYHYNGREQDLKKLAAAANTDADEEVRYELNQAVKSIKKRVAKRKAEEARKRKEAARKKKEAERKKREAAKKAQEKAAKQKTPK